MSMNMGFGMYQSLDARMSQEARMDQHMEMLQQMSGDLESLLDEGPYSPDAHYETMVRRLTEGMSADIGAAVRQLLLGTTHNELPIRREVIRTPVTMSKIQPGEPSAPTRAPAIAMDRLREFAVRRLYDFAQLHGGFHDGTREYKTLSPLLVDAFNDPEGAARALQTAEDLVNQTGSAGNEGAMQNLRERRDALVLRQALQPQADSLIQTLTYVYARMHGGRPVFRDFFRDYVVLRRLIFFESSRLQQRFVNRFSQVGKRAKPRDCEEAALNLIGEYVLVSMGVIAPEVFQMHRGEVDEVAVDQLREMCMDDGVDLDRELQRHRLKREGTFFWHRYALTAGKQDRVSDNAVRAFITETVRKQREQLLSALGYAELFADVKEANADRGDGDDESGEESEVELRRLFVRALRRDELKAAVLELARRDWYGDLSRFMNDGGRR